MNLLECCSIKAIGECKRIALRHRVWFRAINRIERGILDLTVKYVNSIRSTKLAKIVTAILNKLTSSMESTADRLVREVGLPAAQKMSAIATSWGNQSAARWAEDRQFARYLAINLSLGQS